MRRQEGYTHTNFSCRKDFGGYTIVEVLIATAIFAGVLLVALAGFMEIGRIFYKSVSVTTTQQTARTIMDSMTADIHSSSSVDTNVNASSVNGVQYNYYCLGNGRYTYILNDRVKSATDYTSTTDFGLIRDQLADNASCADPFSGGTSHFISPHELLGVGMMLTNIAFNTLNDGADTGQVLPIYIDLQIASGEKETSLTPNIRTGILECNQSLTISQYCASAKLTTDVTPGEL